MELIEPCARQFEYKKWHYCESDFPRVFNYLYFRNRAANFAEICNANQMVIKVAINTINSDKLRRSYDDLYLGVTFWETGYYY